MLDIAASRDTRASGHLRSDSPGLPIFLIAASLIALLLLVAEDPFSNFRLLILVIAGSILIGAAVVYTFRHRDYLVFVLLIIEVVASSSFLPETVNSAFRYGLEAVFCLPILPTLWRSRIWSTGGFRLFCLYMAWAFVTVIYSIAPLYSLGRAANNGLLIGALWASTLDVNSADDVIRPIRRYAEASAILAFLLLGCYLILPADVSWQSDQVLDEAGHILWAGTGVSRFVGFLNQPNDIGMVMLTTIPTSLFVWPRVSRRMKAILLASILAITFCTLLANSRSSMFALLIGMGAYVVWRFRTRGALALICCSVLAGGIIVATSSKGLDEYLVRGDVGTLTGRTDIWAFTLDQIKESPLLGKGYLVEGEILSSKYFPVWFGPWDKGPHSSLHEEYLSHAIGVGIPAALFWLFVVLRPWISLFRSRADPWNLKPLALLAVLPVFILGLTESSAGDCHYSVGLLFMLLWSIAERYRLEMKGLLGPSVRVDATSLWSR